MSRFRSRESAQISPLPSIVSFAMGSREGMPPNQRCDAFPNTTATTMSRVQFLLSVILYTSHTPVPYSVDAHPRWPPLGPLGDLPADY